jgi:hypothetical protein
MPQYLLQLYTPHEPVPADDPGMDIANWRAFTKSLQDAGMFVGADRLYDTESATTVRVRDGETLITDGPFAETNEYLSGYFLLECPSLDVALEQAARVPSIHYGSVEVRPVMANPEGSPNAQAAAQA